jgi:hypothetical protein
MSDIDFDHINNLFGIIAGCAQHTGKFGSIQTEAFNELMKINNDFREKQMANKKADEELAAEHAARQPKLRAIPDPDPDPTGPQVDPDLGAPRSEVEDPQNPTIVDRRI